MARKRPREPRMLLSRLVPKAEDAGAAGRLEAGAAAGLEAAMDRLEPEVAGGCPEAEVARGCPEAEVARGCPEAEVARGCPEAGRQRPPGARGPSFLFPPPRTHDSPYHSTVAASAGRTLVSMDWARPSRM